MTADLILIAHAPHCSTPNAREVIGKLGDTMIRCDSCWRFRFLGDDVPNVGATTAPRPAKSAAGPALSIPPSGYAPRYGDRWPTHKAKARRKQANRQRPVGE